jgi:signal transduction histidine kinase
MHEIALRIRSALGLRGRIAGVVLLTAVATLAVAAVALLGPLEHSLRKGEQTTLKRELVGSARSLRTDALCDDENSDKPAALAVTAAERSLGRRIGGGAIVTVLTGADPETGQGAHQLKTAKDHPAIPDDSFSDVAQAFRTQSTTTPVYSIGTIDHSEYAREAIWFTMDCPAPTGQTEYVLAVRRSIAEIPEVVRVVNRAFLDAALAGLALTLLLGIPLSWRLVRRLRRLREAAVAIEQDSPQAPVPVDNARDEVGDLARALASMQQRLRRQEQARRSFVATASHELRTPLASLDGMLELLDEDLHDSDLDLGDSRDLLDRARAQSRRLGRLAADLLDLSRIDAEVQLRSEPVELGELSRAVLAEFELGTEERGIRSALEGLEGDPVWALGDPGSVARILRILLDNAVRASPVDGHITVELIFGAEALVRVSDEGPGVPEDEREAIFQRFSRGRDTAGQAGFGLGLAIGRELARRMGGELVLEPAGPCGATFTLRLPAALAPDGTPVPVA